jgi:hypothetical protein
MTIAPYQIATVVLGMTSASLGAALIITRRELHGLEKRLREARDHVRSLQEMLYKVSVESDDFRRQNEELNQIVNMVHDQRQKALRKAQEKNREANEAKAATKAQATVKTLSALQASPLRPRDEVVANIRSSKAAQQVSSAN